MDSLVRRVEKEEEAEWADFVQKVENMRSALRKLKMAQAAGGCQEGSARKLEQGALPAGLPSSFNPSLQREAAAFEELVGVYESTAAVDDENELQSFPLAALPEDVKERIRNMLPAVQICDQMEEVVKLCSQSSDILLARVPRLARQLKIHDPNAAQELAQVGVWCHLATLVTEKSCQALRKLLLASDWSQGQRKPGVLCKAEMLRAALSQLRRDICCFLTCVGACFDQYDLRDLDTRLLTAEDSAVKCISTTFALLAACSKAYELAASYSRVGLVQFALAGLKIVHLSGTVPLGSADPIQLRRLEETLVRILSQNFGPWVEHLKAQLAAQASQEEDASDLEDLLAVLPPLANLSTGASDDQAGWKSMLEAVRNQRVTVAHLFRLQNMVITVEMTRLVGAMRVAGVSFGDAVAAEAITQHASRHVEPIIETAKQVLNSEAIGLLVGLPKARFGHYVGMQARGAPAEELSQVRGSLQEMMWAVVAMQQAASALNLLSSRSFGPRTLLLQQADSLQMLAQQHGLYHNGILAAIFPLPNMTRVEPTGLVPSQKKAVDEVVLGRPMWKMSTEDCLELIGKVQEKGEGGDAGAVLGMAQRVEEITVALAGGELEDLLAHLHLLR